MALLFEQLLLHCFLFKHLYLFKFKRDTVITIKKVNNNAIFSECWFGEKVLQ